MPDADPDVSAPCWHAIDGLHPLALMVQPTHIRDDEHGKIVRTIG